jgi:hypothetical protein
MLEVAVRAADLGLLEQSRRACPLDRAGPAGADVADRRSVRHSGRMADTHDHFEDSARIVEAFAESETDDRVLELLRRIAQAIRDHALNN